MSFYDALATNDFFVDEFQLEPAREPGDDTALPEFCRGDGCPEHDGNFCWHADRRSWVNIEILRACPKGGSNTASGE